MTALDAMIDRLFELTFTQDLSFYELAHRSGIPFSTLKSILAEDSKNPGICNVSKLARGLGISVPQFFDSKLFDEVDSDGEE